MKREYSDSKRGNYDYIKDATVILNTDIETLVSIEGSVVRADWYDADEGLYGDYNPEDNEDIHLLRFDIYIKKDGDWESIDDASYCTRVPFETDTDTLVKLLYSIYKEYDNVLSDNPDSSVKRLGESLSWIEP